jgi:putative ABC transport system permease protein
MESVDVGVLEVAAAASLIGVAVFLSLWRGLEVHRDLVVASVRSLAQLLIVGALFTFIFDTGGAVALAWMWVALMVAVTVFVVGRRAPAIPGLRLAALEAVVIASGVSLGLVFGLGVFDHDPVTVVVIAGITLGNVLPSAVLAAKQVEMAFVDDIGQVEALLALGFDERGATRFVGPRAARTALIGQIERTKVVGLIALPGAMTGLLLAGVDPVDAVLVQIIVMYLILGATALVVTSIVWAASRAAYTDDLRLADWTRRT